jgi:hypothetical protein
MDHVKRLFDRASRQLALSLRAHDRGETDLAEDLAALAAETLAHADEIPRFLPAIAAAAIGLIRSLFSYR